MASTESISAGLESAWKAAQGCIGGVGFVCLQMQVNRMQELAGARTPLQCVQRAVRLLTALGSDVEAMRTALTLEVEKAILRANAGLRATPEVNGMTYTSWHRATLCVASDLHSRLSVCTELRGGMDDADLWTWIMGQVVEFSHQDVSSINSKLAEEWAAADRMFGAAPVVAADGIGNGSTPKRKAPGGRPPEWSKLLKLYDEKQSERLSHQEIVSLYRQRNPKRKKPTVKTLQNAIDARKRANGDCKQSDS